MRAFTVSKDKFGLVYKAEPGTTWQRFPDNVTTPDQMMNYFTEGGFDKPNLIFSGDKQGGKKLYQITRKGYKVSALVDLHKSLSFEPEQFMAINEQIAFLQLKATRETEQEAEQHGTDKEKLNCYLQNADQVTIQELQTRIAGSITPERITQLCQDHARQYHGMEAKVEFIGC